MAGLIEGMFGRPSAQITDLQNPALWFTDFAQGRRTTSGERVDSNTAMTLAPYYNGLRVISEDIAKLPLPVSKTLESGGRERLPEHRVHVLLNVEPNPEMTAMAYRETITHHAAGWGNGYSEIQRNGAGEPIALWPIHPSRVEIKRVMLEGKRQLVYDVHGDFSKGVFDPEKRFEIVRLRAEDVLHVHGLSGDGILGYSVLRFGAESLGIALASQKFAAAFYGKGTHPGGVLEHPEKLSPEAMNNIRESWSAVYGLAENAYKPAVLNEGMKWKPTSIPPNEAQFLETRNFQVEEIARWFRLPPHKLQHLVRSTFSNIEQQSIEYVVDTLTPWAIRWEQEIKRKLLRNEADVNAIHTFQSLLRGDAVARTKFYKQMFNMAAFSPNQILELEDINPDPSPAADRKYIQMNMTTLESVASGENLQGDNNSGNGANDTEFSADLNTFMFAHQAIFQDAAARVIRKEINVLSQGIKRYADDEHEFVAWLDKFMTGHESYISDAFMPAIDTAISLMTWISDKKVNVDDVLSEYIDNYIETAKARAAVAFTEQMDVSVWESSITDEMAQDVMNLVKKAILDNK